MAYATFDDVRVRFHGELSEDDRPLVEARLGDVEGKIRRRIPDLEARIAGEPDLVQTVITVCCEAVLRLIRNPEGFIQETEGNYTYMLSQDFASNRLTILPEEWADLGVRRQWTVVHTRVKLPWEVEA